MAQLKNFILRIYKKLIGQPLQNKLEGEFKIGSNSITDNFSIVCRIPNPNTRVFVGDDCVINGQFVFEKESGRITVGDRTFIGGGQFISIDEIEIGNDVLISWGCTIMDNDAHSLKWEERQTDVADWKKGIEKNKIGYYKSWDSVKHAPIVIKDKAWVGFNTIVLRGVTIGVGAVIGAGSVVRDNVPDYCVAYGNPAKVVKTLK